MPRIDAMPNGFINSRKEIAMIAIEPIEMNLSRRLVMTSKEHKEPIQIIIRYLISLTKVQKSPS